jgi:hypothetical protein
VVRVVIYYTDAGGTVESATSAATGAVAATNDAPTGGASITGTATENQVLTADTSTLADSDGLGTLHYQWQHNVGSACHIVGAADQATYTLGDADVGGLVRVVVSYTDGQGFANSVTSAATADHHRRGQRSAHRRRVDHRHGDRGPGPDGRLDPRRRRRPGDAALPVAARCRFGLRHIVGAADQATYTLGDGDVGGVVRVVISYTDGQGFSESATSAATAVDRQRQRRPDRRRDRHRHDDREPGPDGRHLALADIDGLGTLHYQWQHDVGSGFVNRRRPTRRPTPWATPTSAARSA